MTAALALTDDPLTDVGNAERLIALHGDRLHYVSKWNSWFIFDGTVWAIDEAFPVEQLAHATVRELAAQVLPGDQETAKHAKRSESNASIKAMIERARALPGVAISHTRFDTAPYLFNVQNGTLDLETGELRPHSRDDYITKKSPVRYNRTASRPQWERFLLRVMAGRPDLIDFLQRMTGYLLSGDTGEHCLFFLYGLGANGKSTFLRVLLSILGDYAAQAGFATFLDKKFAGGPSSDIARLVGRRMVASSEVSEGRRFDESLLKSLTGGDPITARFLFQEPFEFQPTFKIVLAANTKPRIHEAGTAMWRRMRIIPFTVEISEAERDHELAEKLLAEQEGILAWAVEGCALWRTHGLNPPAEVLAATQEYRETSDVLGSFLAERCIANPIDPQLSALGGRLFKAFEAWCVENGERAWSAKAFAQALTERGFAREVRGHRKETWRLGIELIDNAGDEDRGEMRVDAGRSSSLMSPYAHI